MSPLIPTTGQSPLAESPEAAKKAENQNLDNADKQANQERLRSEFNNHAEVKLASVSLDGLVDPETKENILGRLLLKYEKGDFDFADALHKVFYGEDMGGMRSSGIDMENKNDVYHAVMNATAQALGIQEDTGDVVEENAGEVVEEVKSVNLESETIPLDSTEKIIVEPVTVEEASDLVVETIDTEEKINPVGDIMQLEDMVVIGKIDDEEDPELSKEEQEEDKNVEGILAKELDRIDQDPIVEDEIVLAEKETVEPVVGNGYPQPEEAVNAPIEVVAENAITLNEHPLSPIINSFVPQGVSAAEAIQINTGLAEGTEIRDVLASMDINDNRVNSLTDALNYLEKPEVIEKNRETFNVDFKDQLEQFKVPGEAGDMEFSGVTADAVDMLGGNYFVNLEKRVAGNEDIQKSDAINIAFERSFNQMIDGISITRDQKFDDMKQIITNPDADFAERFNEFIELSKEINTGEGVKGLKDKTAGKKLKATATANNNAVDNFQEGQRNRAEAEAELHANDKALEDSKTLQPKPEVQEGEVFSGGEKDAFAGLIST